MCKRGGRYVHSLVSYLQQTCKSACKQITDMTHPENEEEESEEDVKKTVSVEVSGQSASNQDVAPRLLCGF